MCYKIQCKMCRQITFDVIECKQLLLNVHNEPLLILNDNKVDDCLNDNSSIYLNEDHLPDWLRTVIEEHSWSKGKINCRHCNSRLGSFDFTSGLKCNCNNYVVPAIHLVKSKIDLIPIKK